METRSALEASVAACVLMRGGKNVNAVDINPDDFNLLPARYVLMAANEMGAIDPLIVRAWAKENGHSIKLGDITALLQSTATGHNFCHYVSALKKQIYSEKHLALREALIDDSKVTDNLSITWEQFQKKEDELKSLYLATEDGAGLANTGLTILGRIETGTDDEIFQTKNPIIDEITGGGLMGNEYYLLAARPGMGKTAFALQIAADCDEKVAVFSLEMSEKQLAGRLLASTALKSVTKAMRKPSTLTEDERKHFLSVQPTFLEACDRITVFDKAAQTMTEIRRNSRKAVADGCKLIIIDYLQLIKLEKGPVVREQYISQISAELKALAKELNVPIIVLAQLSRKSEEQNRSPVNSDLRESGSLEQDADVIWFLHPAVKSESEKRNPILPLWLIQSKNRHVGERIAKIIFNKPHQRFNDEN